MTGQTAVPRPSEAVAAASGGGANIAGAAFNSAARLLVTLSIARLLGDEPVGLYYIAIAVHDLLALLCSGGFQTALTRFVSAHLATGDMPRLRGTLQTGRGIPVIAACAVGATLALIASPLANGAFDQPTLVRLFVCVAIALPASVFTDVTLAATRGYRTMKPYAVIGLVFQPGMRLVVTVLAIWNGSGILGALIALIVSNYIAAGVASRALRRITGRLDVRPVHETSALLRFSAVTWASTLAIDAFIWADTLLLGILRSAEEVGVYQVASRLVLLAAIFVMPFTQAVAPRISDLYARGDLDELRALYVTITGWMVRLALVPTLILVIAPRELLSIFGPSFTEGAAVTVILAAGALIHATTGPSGAMLNMTGRPAWALANNVATVIVNIALNLVLIPPYGIIGAATAWTSSLVFTNVLVAWQIKRALNVHPFGSGFARSFIAAIPAALAGAGIKIALDTRSGSALAVIVATAVYLVMLRSLGLSDDDRAVWRHLVARLRPAKTV